MSNVLFIIIHKNTVLVKCQRNVHISLDIYKLMIDYTSNTQFESIFKSNATVFPSFWYNFHYTVQYIVDFNNHDIEQALVSIIPNSWTLIFAAIGIFFVDMKTNSNNKTENR